MRIALFPWVGTCLSWITETSLSEKLYGCPTTVFLNIITQAPPGPTAPEHGSLMMWQPNRSKISVCLNLKQAMITSLLSPAPVPLPLLYNCAFGDPIVLEAWISWVTSKLIYQSVWKNAMETGK